MLSSEVKEMMMTKINGMMHAKANKPRITWKEISAGRLKEFKRVLRLLAAWITMLALLSR